MGTCFRQKEMADEGEPALDRRNCRMRMGTGACLGRKKKDLRERAETENF